MKKLKWWHWTLIAAGIAAAAVTAVVLSQKKNTATDTGAEYPSPSPVETDPGAINDNGFEGPPSPGDNEEPTRQPLQVPVITMTPSPSPTEKP